MSRRLRVVLLIGCLGLCALGAPGAGALLAQGPDAAQERSRSTPGAVSARMGSEATPGFHTTPLRTAPLAAARIASR